MEEEEHDDEPGEEGDAQEMETELETPGARKRQSHFVLCVSVVLWKRARQSH